MGTKLSSSQISVSPDSGNLIQSRTNGLFVQLAAPPDLSVQYVSSVSGNDANPGTRAQPLKTLAMAMSRLPSYTSGSILLKEGETFPVAPVGAPAWGTTITEPGYPMPTDNKSILIGRYGTDSDTYTPLFENTSETPDGMQNAVRPILEFGHWVYEGDPVGSSLIFDGNGHCQIFGCEVRFTSATRTLVQSSGTPWRSHGWTAPITIADGRLLGVVLPAPITNTGNTQTLNPVVWFDGKVALWNVSVPAGTQPWAQIFSTTFLTVIGAVTMTDKNGATYPALPNTVATNISTRVAGITRDANDTPRNIMCNLIL